MPTENDSKVALYRCIDSWTTCDSRLTTDDKESFIVSEAPAERSSVVRAS
jgi:hypothetical protein